MPKTFEISWHQALDAVIIISFFSRYLALNMTRKSWHAGDDATGKLGAVAL